MCARARRVVGVLLLSALPAAAQQTICPGDCTVDGEVGVNEIVTMVGAVLAAGSADGCAAGDADGDGQLRINDVTRAVGSVLNGCSAAARGQAAFYRTLDGSEDRSDAVVDILGAAVEENPADGWSWFLLGMNHLLRLGRMLTDYDDPPPAAVAEVRAASAALDRAVPLLTFDDRIPGFRGAATYMLGVVTDDAVAVGLGLAQLAEAIEANPLFNSFSFLGTVAPTVAADDPLFAQGIVYLEAGINAGCTPLSDPRNCGNGGRAPHNLQGTFLLFGDIYTKAGRLPVARGYYNLALRFEGADTWQFGELNASRLASVEERAALYADEDPDNDPLLVGAGPEACAYCHYK